MKRECEERGDAGIAGVLIGCGSIYLLDSNQGQMRRIRRRKEKRRQERELKN